MSIEKEKQKRQFFDNQKKNLNLYRDQKRKADALLGAQISGSPPPVSMLFPGEMGGFYERKQNFGFPITTTSHGGVITTVTTGLNPGATTQSMKHTNGLDGLTKLTAEVKAGQVQLEDMTFATGSFENKKSGKRPPGAVDDYYENDF